MKRLGSQNVLISSSQVFDLFAVLGRFLGPDTAYLEKRFHLEVRAKFSSRKFSVMAKCLGVLTCFLIILGKLHFIGLTWTQLDITFKVLGRFFMCKNVTTEQCRTEKCFF